MPPSSARAWLPIGATLALNLLGVALFVWLSRAGFPGEPSACLERFVCYCEVPRGGLARQPFNTWSNLAVVPVALGIAYDASGLRAGLQRTVGMTFAFAESWQGLASIYFHGSLTTWAAVLDGVSIFLVVGLVLAVNLLRLGRLKPAQIPWFLALSAGAALAYRLLLLPVMAPLFLVGAGAVVWSERSASRLGAAPPSRRWFVRALWLLGAAVLALSLSLLPGFPLCSEVFPWGHAVWHVLCALLTGALWLHAREMLAPSLRHPRR